MRKAMSAVVAIAALLAVSTPGQAAAATVLATYSFNCISANSVSCQGTQALESQLFMDVSTVDGVGNELRVRRRRGLDWFDLLQRPVASFGGREDLITPGVIRIIRQHIIQKGNELPTTFCAHATSHDFIEVMFVKIGPSFLSHRLWNLDPKLHCF